MGFLSHLFSEEPTSPANAEDIAVKTVAFAARLTQIEIVAHRLVAGLSSGSFLSAVLGSGWDTAEARDYQPGDDVRRIDWPATARTGVTQVRPTYAERELLTAVIIDGSASMMFGTLGLTKFELSVAVSAAISEIALRRGNPVAMARATADNIDWFPIVDSRTEQRIMLRRATLPFVAKKPAQLAEALWQLNRTHPRCRSVVVCTDALIDEIEEPLRALAATRHVSVVEPYDRRERELLAVGDAAFSVLDDQFWLDTDSAEIRKRFNEIALQRAAERSAMVRRTGSVHVAIPCDSDWRDEVATALVKTVAEER